jgi:hypothetical protein
MQQRHNNTLPRFQCALKMKMLCRKAAQHARVPQTGAHTFSNGEHQGEGKLATRTTQTHTHTHTI